jgi:hypothetical protein
MKNLLLGIVLIIGLTFATSVSADIDDDCAQSGVPTMVNGQVFSGPDSTSLPVAGVTVDVTCNGVTHSAETADPSGWYGVIFQIPDNCNIGMTATSCVGSNCEEAVIEDCFSNPINIVGIDIFNVPEFGLVAASVAMAGAVAGFIFLRRKK